MAVIKFLANNIKNGKTTYEQIALSRPDLKDVLRTYMIENGLGYLLTD